MAKLPKALKAELVWVAAQQLRLWLTGWLAKRRKKSQPKEPAP